MGVSGRGECRDLDGADAMLTAKQRPRRLTSTTIDVLIEVWLGVLPSAICWKLQMARSKKWKVTIAFSSRLT